MTTPLLIGADCGGTASRAIVMQLDGTVLGTGRAGSGNPLTRTAGHTTGQLGGAIRAALGDLSPRRVIGGVVGVAGAGSLAKPGTMTAYRGLWAEFGLPELALVEDAVVAFAAGTPEPTGTVLIAGTGAVAAHIHEATVGETADGLGWLLGDVGSGFWLGVNAVRATVRELRENALGSLGVRVVAALRAGTPDELIAWCYRVPRARIGALAVLVSAAAAEGDPSAIAIADEAGTRLAETLAAAHPGTGPLVIAGSVAASPGRIRETLLREAGTRTGQLPLIAGDGARAAAWLAAGRTGALSGADLAAAHPRFMSA